MLCVRESDPARDKYENHEEGTQQGAFFLCVCAVRGWLLKSGSSLNLGVLRWPFLKLIELDSHYPDIFWRRNAEAHLVSGNADHGDGYAVADAHGFVLFASEDKHTQVTFCNTVAGEQPRGEGATSS